MAPPPNRPPNAQLYSFLLDQRYVLYLAVLVSAVSLPSLAFGVGCWTFFARPNQQAARIDTFLRVVLGCCMGLLVVLDVIPRCSPGLDNKLSAWLWKLVEVVDDHMEGIGDEATKASAISAALAIMSSVCFGAIVAPFLSAALDERRSVAVGSWRRDDPFSLLRDLDEDDTSEVSKGSPDGPQLQERFRLDSSASTSLTLCALFGNQRDAVRALMYYCAVVMTQLSLLRLYGIAADNAGPAKVRAEFGETDEATLLVAAYQAARNATGFDTDLSAALNSVTVSQARDSIFHQLLAEEQKKWNMAFPVKLATYVSTGVVMLLHAGGDAVNALRLICLHARIALLKQFRGEIKVQFPCGDGEPRDAKNLPPWPLQVLLVAFSWARTPRPPRILRTISSPLIDRATLFSRQKCSSA